MIGTSPAKICSKFLIFPTRISDVSQHFKDEDQPELYLKNQLVPRGEHTWTVISTALLMLYGEEIAVHSDVLYHHHSVFCLTTGSKPPPKRFLHIVRSRASSFK
jgi:hypothetical protein